MTFAELKDQILNYPKLIMNGKISSGVLTSKKFMESQLLTEISKHTAFLNKVSITHRIWHIVNDEYSILKCHNCDNPVKFQSFVVGYREFCSTKCVANSSLTKDKIKATSIENHGVAHFNNPTKTKQTKLEKYGDEKYCNTNKIKHTKKDRYDDENYNNVAKAKQTCLDRYGETSFRKTPEHHKTARKTKLDRYGDENYNNRDRTIETNMYKYNVKNVAQLPGVIEKIRNTCLSKYGVISKKQIHYNVDTKNILLDKNKFIEFAENKTQALIAHYLEVDTTTISNYIALYGCKDIINVASNAGTWLRSHLGQR